VNDLQFNVSLGREVELYNRVKLADPANAAFIVLVLATDGNDSNDPQTMRSYENVAAVLAQNPEVTNGTYARKTIVAADIAPYVIDHAQNRIVLKLPVLTWATPAAGDAWDYALVAYDSDATGGTDANLIPISLHPLRVNEAALVPNGSPIVFDLSSEWIVARQ
jgi:hypothetical protein